MGGKPIHETLAPDGYSSMENVKKTLRWGQPHGGMNANVVDLSQRNKRFLLKGESVLLTAAVGTFAVSSFE